MKTKDFLEKLKDNLQFTELELTPETVLNTMPDYDSLAVMYLVSFVDEYFEKQLSTDEIESITTVRSLMDLLGAENFDD